MIPELLRTGLDASLRVVVLAAAVAALLAAARVKASGVRHAVWTAVLAAMLLMPVLPSVLPSIAVPMPVRPAAPVTALDVVPPPPVFDAPAAPVSQPAPVVTRATPAIDAPAAPPVQSIWSRWPVALAGVYLAGVCVLLARLLIGWRASARVVRSSRAVEARKRLPESAFDVRESALVATPLTIGVIRPRVLLPLEWRRWSRPTVAAVLAHEGAHINRHDPLVALLAHVNRCVFWFHPLAWWLERTLASTAEDACDDAGVKAMGESKGYAEVLLGIADAVRRRGSRLSWQGVGIDGNGLIAHRIDRVLRGDVVRPISRTRTAIVALGCTAAIVLVVSCRQKVAEPVEPAPLTPDPTVAANIASQKALTEFYAAAHAMTPQQVSDAETALVKNPEDVDTRKKLLAFYQWTGKNTISWNDDVLARRRHALWLTEHHPESDLLESGRLTAAADPAGYAEARTLWLAATAKPGVTTRVLSNAAYFFEESEKPMAEQLLMRAQTMEPDGPQPRTFSIYFQSWPGRLGSLYARVIVGSVGSTLGNVVHETSVLEAHNAYATTIRKKLDETKDAKLLGSAASYLLSNAGEAKVDFDRVALARSYLERASQLDPAGAARYKRLLLSIDSTNRHNRQYERLKGIPREQRDATILSWPEDQRFEFLADRIELAETLAYQTGKNTTTAKAEWDLAKKLADDGLALAAKRPNDPDRSVVFYRAHIALGMAAFVDGDQQSAIDHLTAAGNVPASDDLAYRASEGSERLSVYLLKAGGAGVREPVAAFYERMAVRNGVDHDRLLKDAASVRAGRMTLSYQYMFNRQGQ